jgi:ABC-2 type transport system ATP-binding protein
MADAVAEDGVTVLLSSHLLADMERVVDYLILLSASHVQLCGDIDELLAEHHVLVGPRKDTDAIAQNHTIVQTVHTARQTTLLVRGNAPVADPGWEKSEVGLEEMVLAYMGQDAAPAISHMTSVGEEQ